VTGPRIERFDSPKVGRFPQPTSQQLTSERHRDVQYTRDMWPTGTPFDASSIDPNPVHSPHQPLHAISPVLQHYPSSSRQTSIAADGPGRKRKRSYAGDDAVENSGEDGLMQDSPSSTSKGKHQPGVKRACNDCRQQKVGEAANFSS
jgi:hypothetical protein